MSDRGRLYIMGERGPESIMPGRRRRWAGVAIWTGVAVAYAILLALIAYIAVTG